MSFELDLDGAVTESGAAIAHDFLDFGLPVGAHGKDTGAQSFGLIDGTLTVTRQASGTTVAVDFTA